jgi:hypothetical protein
VCCIKDTKRIEGGQCLPANRCELDRVDSSLDDAALLEDISIPKKDSAAPPKDAAQEDAPSPKIDQTVGKDKDVTPPMDLKVDQSNNDTSLGSVDQSS